jgi:hypothetical protein
VLTCAWPVGIGAGDLDNNGTVDLAVVDFPTPTSAVLQPLLGNGVGVYTPLPASTFSAGNGPFVNLTLADLCSVGRLDAFVGAGGRPFLFVNDGTGQFQATSQGIAQGGIGCSLALAADLDHDGRLDLVFGSVSGVSAFALTPPAKPPGASTFGNGTPGCSGIHGIDANVKAAVGASFIVTATNAPPSSLGLFLAGDAVNVGGTDPFGVAVALYIDFYASQQLVALDVVSDRNGSGSVLLIVPNAPQLAGLTVYSQVLFAWLGTGCTPSLFTLSSSRCLVSTVQP